MTARYLLVRPGHMVSTLFAAAHTIRDRGQAKLFAQETVTPR